MSPGMGDPMDSPPADHGSDRYDYVEWSAPEGIAPPSGEWWETLIAEPCPDCRANVFATWVGEDGGGREPNMLLSPWEIEIAHDDGCPFLAKEGTQ